MAVVHALYGARKQIEPEIEIAVIVAFQRAFYDNGVGLDFFHRVMRTNDGHEYLVHRQDVSLAACHLIILYERAKDRVGRGGPVA